MDTHFKYTQLASIRLACVHDANKNRIPQNLITIPSIHTSTSVVWLQTDSVLF